MLRKKILIAQNLTISNILTGSRIVLTPFVVNSLLRHSWGSALAFFCFAGFSDLLDGFIARLLNEPTSLGAILDPIADKVLVVCTLAAFLASSPNLLLPSWFVIVIAIREAILLVGGALLFWLKPSIQIKPSLFGKATTCFIIILMILVLWGAFTGVALQNYSLLFLYASLFAAVVSFFQYAYRAILFLI